MNLISVDEVVVMTVDGFAYHYHHHPRPHPHPHPYPYPHPQIPHHQQETFHFPFSFFLLPLLFFHLGELGQPNHVQFRVTVTVMTVIFYFFSIFPVVVQGSGKKKASWAETKKKSNFRPISRCHHPSHIHGWNCQQKEKKRYCGRDICGWWWWSSWFFSSCFHCISCSAFLMDYCNERQKERERDRETERGGW